MFNEENVGFRGTEDVVCACRAEVGEGRPVEEVPTDEELVAVVVEGLCSPHLGKLTEQSQRKYAR